MKLALIVAAISVLLISVASGTGHDLTPWVDPYCLDFPDDPTCDPDSPYYIDSAADPFLDPYFDPCADPYPDPYLCGTVVEPAPTAPVVDVEEVVADAVEEAVTEALEEAAEDQAAIDTAVEAALEEAAEESTTEPPAEIETEAPATSSDEEGSSFLIKLSDYFVGILVTLGGVAAVVITALALLKRAGNKNGKGGGKADGEEDSA